MARALHLAAGTLDTAVDCGVLTAEQSPGEQWQALRRMRRLIDDLGVNGPAAALLVRMARDLQQLQSELARMQGRETRFFAAWTDARWLEVDELDEL